jgi:hypothetical protein
MLRRRPSDYAAAVLSCTSPAFGNPEGDFQKKFVAARLAPLDAGKAETFLNLPEKLGESMDLDHVATVSFAHWPGQASEWYEDLRRMANYAPVLGKFVTIGEFFAKTVNAKISFTQSGDAPATALVLHQGGRDMTAPRAANKP